MGTNETEEARVAAREALGEDAEGMSLAEVIRDLQADRELLQGELREAQERLGEFGEGKEA